MPYYKLLEDQIQKSLSPEQLNDPAIQGLLQQVDQSYKNFERDTKLHEHAFLFAEKEYQAVIHNLQSQNNIHCQLVKKLKDAIMALDPGASVIFERGDHELLYVITYLEKQTQKRKEAFLNSNDPAIKAMYEEWLAKKQ